MSWRKWSAAALTVLVAGAAEGAVTPLRAQMELAVASSALTAAPPAGNVLDRTFSTHIQNLTLRDALHIIGDLTGANFAFSAAVIPADRRVTLDATNMTVRDALAALLAHLSIAVVPTGAGVVRLEPKAAAPADNGTITGHVRDSAGRPLAGASVSIVGNLRYGGYTGSDGSYVIPDVPVGSYRLSVHFIGFRTDTVAVSVRGGQTTTSDIALKAVPTTLNTVVITSPRLNETVAGALQEQKQADNIMTVMSGDQIRGLPNYNAAEALARLPGVTAERDEGEGKYVEIRGTPPDFQHVTIDGADVPGTLATDVRAVKLDDVPADVLGAIEVNKTLSADIDADAIGGSVNLVTKVPEGTPRGYISGLYGYQTLLSNNNGHGDVSYGGRLGTDQKFGFLVSGSIDRTDRVINDVEPSYTGEVLDNGTGMYEGVPGSTYTHVQASQWSQREYNYYRTRYGLAQDLDYRFSPTSSIYLKGLWSAFFDEANRWETNLAAGGDQLIAGVPTATQATLSNTVSNRGPIEHTWGFTGGGKQSLGNVQLTYAANYAGSTANQHAHFEDDYGFNPSSGPGAGGTFNYTYSANNLIPRYSLNPALSEAAALPANWQLGSLNTDYEQNSGAIVGAKADALIPYEIGTLPASFKFGVKIENQHKGYLSYQPSYTPNNNLTMSQFLSNYRDPGFYGSICAGCYQLAPFGSLPAVNQNLVGNPSAWTYQNSGLSDSAATFAGTEETNAGYIMQTVDISRLHVNAGLRVENTNVGYVGYATVGPDSAPSISPVRVHGSSNYTDLFPSLQLKYEVDENTNLRFAVTRGIARPDYASLAPDVNAVDAVKDNINQGISLGNPSLKPEHAWNYDLLAEHYLSSVGVLSGGLFYKSINDFIFNRTELYNGSITQYDGYYASQPQNGPSATLWGAEFDYMQHLTFLPGALRGLGFDVNYTHVESRAIVPQDTASGDVGYTDPNTGKFVNQFAGQPFRHVPLPRQFPTLFNVSVLYDYSSISARLTGQYTSASIYQYGSNGTSNPQNSDTYNYAHFQIDAAATWNVFARSAITLQVLDMNNAVFGFFTGTTRHPWNNQREYYGTTLFLGYRQGL